MEIHKILDKLKEFNIETIAETGMPAYIQTHKMIKPGQKSFYSACIYAGYVSELPEKLESDHISNLICIEDKPLDSNFVKSGEMNLYLIHNSAVNQFDVLNKIADIMIDEATVTSAMRRILDELYINAGLQPLVDVASEVFENPIFVNDTAFKILAMSQNCTFPNKTLEDEKELGYVHADNVSALYRDRIFGSFEDSNKILYSERKDKNERWLFKAVKLHDVAIAHIAIVDNNRPFRDMDYELLERFANIVAIEMEKNEFYKDNKGVMYSYLLGDILSGKLQNKKALEQRAKFLDWKMYHWFQLAVVADRRKEMFDDKIQFIGHEIRNIIPDCRWTYYQKSLVLFLSRPSENMVSENEDREFKRFVNENNLVVGVSTAFENLGRAYHYYVQALRTVDAADEREKCGVFYFDEMIPDCIAVLLSKRYNLRDFCPSSIEKIQKYDAENNTNMIETLDKYLMYVNDPLYAAKSLNIHRNTLLYRINKIKELSGINLSDGNQRLKIQLYLKFMKYQQGSLK